MKILIQIRIENYPASDKRINDSCNNAFRWLLKILKIKSKYIKILKIDMMKGCHHMGS